MSRYRGMDMTVEEIMETPSREVLLEYRMVTEAIKDYSVNEQFKNPDKFMELIQYRAKLATVIIEKMESYDKMAKENGGIL